MARLDILSGGMEAAKPPKAAKTPKPAKPPKPPKPPTLAVKSANASTILLIKLVPAATFCALIGTQDKAIAEAIRAEFSTWCKAYPQHLKNWRAAWTLYREAEQESKGEGRTPCSALVPPSVQTPVPANVIQFPQVEQSAEDFIRNL